MLPSMIQVRSAGLEIKYTSYMLDKFQWQLGDNGMFNYLIVDVQSVCKAKKHKKIEHYPVDFAVWSIKEQRCLAFIDSFEFGGAQVLPVTVGVPNLNLYLAPNSVRLIDGVDRARIIPVFIPYLAITCTEAYIGVRRQIRKKQQARSTTKSNDAGS